MATFLRQQGLFIDVKNYNHDRGGRNWNINHDHKNTSYADFQRGEKNMLHMCVFVCTHVNFEVVIEMFVCASDGATGWQDGGASLTGKPEQEEQTPY